MRIELSANDLKFKKQEQEEKRDRYYAFLAHKQKKPQRYSIILKKTGKVLKRGALLEDVSKYRDPTKYRLEVE